MWLAAAAAEVAECIEVVLMGGCLGVGNTGVGHSSGPGLHPTLSCFLVLQMLWLGFSTHFAGAVLEFNTRVDPHLPSGPALFCRIASCALLTAGAVVEFNIQVDPEAAKVVFEAGVPLTMVPLEVSWWLAAAHASHASRTMVAATTHRQRCRAQACIRVAALLNPDGSLSGASPPPPATPPLPPAPSLAVAPGWGGGLPGPCLLVCRLHSTAPGTTQPFPNLCCPLPHTPPPCPPAKVFIHKQ